MTDSVSSKEAQDVSAVFGLQTATNLFEKLVWERNHLHQALAAENYRYPDPTPIYWAFNCAVTAWHLFDWVWAHTTANQKAMLAETHGFQLSKGLKAFRDVVFKVMPELAACHDIANGSKHFKLSRRKSSVKVETSFATVVDPALSGLRPGDHLLTLHVWLSDRNMTAKVFFDRILAFWHELMRSLGMFDNAQGVIEMVPVPPLPPGL